MKIGASTLAVPDGDFEKHLGFYEDLGLEYVELLHYYPDIDENRELLESFNLKYTVHCSNIDLNIASLNENIRKASVADVKNSMDLASKIDAELIVVHPGTVPYNGTGLINLIHEVSEKSIIELGEYGQETGVIPHIENMHNNEVLIHKDLKVLNDLLESLDMFMTLDVGHANTAGYTPEEMYYPSVKHIHLSDNDGSFDSHLALGEGTIDFKAFINKFESENYDGVYMLEITDSVEESYNYIKKVLK